MQSKYPDPPIGGTIHTDVCPLCQKDAQRIIKSFLRNFRKAHAYAKAYGMNTSATGRINPHAPPLQRVPYPGNDD